MHGFHTPESGQVGKGGSGDNPGIALFLALYLLLLAFFILLNAISSFEDVKSKQVMDSLSSTFSTLMPSKVSGSFSSAVGDVLAARAFQGEVGDLFETTIAAAEVEMIQPGELMQITVNSESLFLENSTEIPSSRAALLDRIVASISAAPDTLRYHVEFLIGSDYAMGDELPIGETLEMARAAAFAKEMIKRGAPPQSIKVGLVHGDPREIRIAFRIMEENAARLQFAK